MIRTFSPDVIELNPHLFQSAHTQGAKRRAKSPSISWPSERHFQEAVIAQARLRAALQPEYGLLVAIPNGQYRSGQRAEPGLTPGLPDLALFVARGGHGALFLELKVGRNKPSRAQLDMIHRLRSEGYRCEIVWDSAEEVFDIIESYLLGG